MVNQFLPSDGEHTLRAKRRLTLLPTASTVQVEPQPINSAIVCEELTDHSKLPTQVYVRRLISVVAIPVGNKVEAWRDGVIPAGGNKLSNDVAFALLPGALLDAVVGVSARPQSNPTGVACSKTDLLCAERDGRFYPLSCIE
jgi:hypothetical protein